MSKTPLYGWQDIISMADRWRMCLGDVFCGRMIQFRPIEIDPIALHNPFRDLTNRLIVAATERGIDCRPLHAIQRATRIDVLPDEAWDCVSSLYAAAAHEGRSDQAAPAPPVEWISRSAAAKNASVNPGVITHAVKRGEIVSESEERGSRLDAASVRKWNEHRTKNEAEKQKADELAYRRMNDDGRRADKRMNTMPRRPMR